MKPIRTFVVASLVVSSLAAVPAAALAAGRAPQGNPMYMLTEDYHFSDFTCPEESGVTDFLVARAGNAGWVVGEPDRMYVLQSISAELTLIVPGEQPVTYPWSKTFGNKTGRAESITCTAYFSHEHDGVSEAGPMEFTLVRIW